MARRKRRTRARRRSRSLSGVCCPPSLTGLGDPLFPEVEGPRSGARLATPGLRSRGVGGLVMKLAVVGAAAGAGWWAYRKFIAKQ